MSFWKGVTGGLVGLASGGPVGAGIGVASGLLSNDSTSKGTQTSSRSVDLSNMTDDQRTQYEQSSAGLLESSRGMSPAEVDASRKRNYDALYGRSSDAIEQNYASRGAGLVSSNARRGAAVSSLGRDTEIIERGSESRELGRASQEATIQSEQMMLAERADKRAASAAYQQQLDSIWQKRLSTSKITTRGASTSTSPDTFWQSAMSGLGSAVADDESWLNTKGNDMFGGV